jgi:hypothetical protein
LDIDDGFIGNTHHSGGEFEGGHGFFQVSGFWPDVCDHQGFAVAAQRVTQQIG